MHPRFAALCEALREAGIGITLLSTGLLLAPRAADVAGLVDDVIVSLDGPRDVHDAIRRVPHAFDRLAEGVRALGTAAPSLPVSARCTVQRANARHLRETVAAAREIGLDGISFLAADVAPGAFGRDDSWAEGEGSSVAVGPEDLPVLAAELDALERDCAEELASGFIAESAERLRARILGHFAAHAGQGDFAPLTCNAPWVSAVIEADGTVRPCFFHPAARKRPDGREPRGRPELAHGALVPRLARRGDEPRLPAVRLQPEPAGGRARRSPCPPRTSRHRGGYGSLRTRKGRPPCRVRTARAGRSSSTTRRRSSSRCPSAFSPSARTSIRIGTRSSSSTPGSRRTPSRALLSHLPGALCLGVTVLTGAPIRDAVLASRAAKTARPDLPIVWGGWHPSLFGTECLRGAVGRRDGPGPGGGDVRRDPREARGRGVARGVRRVLLPCSGRQARSATRAGPSRMSAAFAPTTTRSSPWRGTSA